MLWPICRQFQLTSSPPFHVAADEELRVDIRLKPAPGEIVCIRTTILYDHCLQTDDIPNVCAPLPELPQPVIPLACSVSGKSCSFLGSRVLRDAICDVTFVVTLQLLFALGTPLGIVTVPATIMFQKTVQLCAPPGTTQSCDVLSVACYPLSIIDNSVCTTVQVRTAFTSEGLARLLVPTFGICAPAKCATPQFACPPSPLRRG